MNFKVLGSLKVGDEMLPFVMLGLLYELGTSILGIYLKFLVIICCF